MISAIKKRALHRTKILEGQMRGIQKMIDSEEYCMDILAQSLAIQKSLASLDRLVLENHISTHVQEMLTSGDETMKEKAITELSQLYKLNSIRGA